MNKKQHKKAVGRILNACSEGGVLEDYYTDDHPRRTIAVKASDLRSKKAFRFLKAQFDGDIEKAMTTSYGLGGLCTVVLDIDTGQMIINLTKVTHTTFNLKPFKEPEHELQPTS